MDLDMREGQVRVGLRQHADRLTRPLIREDGEVFARRRGMRRWRWLREIHRDQARAWAGCAGVYFFIEVHERRKLPDAEAGARGDRHKQY